MAEGLDMSLDDIIEKNKKSGAGFRGRGRGRGGGGGRGGRDSSSASGPGPTRRFINRQPRRAPYFTPQAEAVQMQDVLIAGGADAESETKLYISNLDYGVSNEDIKVLFSDVGVLKRYSIHYDQSGRSKGTAEVAFVRRADALAAVKRYNNVQLDGKPMKIELVGVKLIAPAATYGPPVNNRKFGNPGSEGAFRRQERVADKDWDRGRGGRGFARGRGRGRGRSEKVSTEDLDAELEKYHIEAMQIN